MRTGALRLLAAVRAVIAGVCVLCFVVMTASITFQVIGRYLLSYQIADAVELSSFLQVWLTCIGAGLAVRYRALFVVDLFGASMPPALRKFRRFLSLAFSTVFIAGVLWGSIRLLQIGTVQRAPTLQIPMWIIYAALPIGFVYLWVELAIQAFSPDQETDGTALD